MPLMPLTTPFFRPLLTVALGARPLTSPRYATNTEAPCRVSQTHGCYLAFGICFYKHSAYFSPYIKQLLSAAGIWRLLQFGMAVRPTTLPGVRST